METASPETAEREHLSFCRICAAACGIVVTTVDTAVTRVRGDADHPYSRGYICSKARGLPAWHYSSRRLDHPMVDGPVVSWDVALDDLAARLRSIVDVDGPDAIGLYLATGLAYDSAGQVGAALWMRSISSSTFYTAATVDNAPVLVAAELLTGNPMLNPVWNPDEPGLLVLVGTNPVISHGYGTTLPDPVRRLRDYRRAGGKVWVLDPRRTESAALADEHVAVRPGSDVAVLGALVRSLIDDGGGDELCTLADVAAVRAAVDPFTFEHAASVAGVSVESLLALDADMRTHRGRLAMFCGTGTTMAADGVLTEWLRWVLLALTGSLDRPGGMRFNRGVVNRPKPPARTAAPARAAADARLDGDADASSGAAGAAASPLPGPASRPELPRVAGQVPSVAMVDEIEAGRLRALMITGGNPLSAFPEPERVRAALESLEVLVVIDVMDSDLCSIATHVLPATGQLERSDLSLAEHVSIRSGQQFTGPVVEPVADRRPVWWMLASLAERMGGVLMPGIDPAVATDPTFLGALLYGAPLTAAEVFAAGPRGIDLPVSHGWVRATMLPGGHWRIAPTVMLERLRAHVPPSPTQLVMTPRREMAWSNSVVYGSGGAEASVLRLSADDAAGAGLVAGELATVTSAHGSVTAAVSVDDTIRPGVVSLTHGHLDQNPGRLTSSTVGVDPLTTMPHASGLPVTIARPAKP